MVSATGSSLRKEKEKMKKLGRILFSMRTAMVILGLLLAACVIGSVLPQGEIEAYYTGYYPEKIGQLILLLDLDDIFHSVWFAVLTIFLCANLLGCNIFHAPGLVRQIRSGFTPEKNFLKWDGCAEAAFSEEPKELFKKMGFSKVKSTKTPDGREYRYAVRMRIGIMGAWFTHLGMLIIVIGFALGQMYTVKYTVYGVPGQTKQVGDTGCELTIDGFEMNLRDDDTVDQYTSQVTMTDTSTGESTQGETSVNHPLKLNGMKIYQNSTGWAAHVQIWKNEELVQHEILCAGEHLAFYDMADLVLAFNAFYPDYVNTDGTPGTASDELNNPAYLYTLYYQGSVLGMNVLSANERITVEDYTIIFTEPQQYTLLQVKRDPFTWIALIGGAVILAALFMAFYLRTEELWIVHETDGSWIAAGRSRKGGILYHDKLLEKAEECGGHLCEEKSGEQGKAAHK